MAILKIHYLRGNSDDPAAIYAELDGWLKETGVTEYQLNSTVHFMPEELQWQILVTIIYKPVAAHEKILRTNLMPQRVD